MPFTVLQCVNKDIIIILSRAIIRVKQVIIGNLSYLLVLVLVHLVQIYLICTKDTFFLADDQPVGIRCPSSLFSKTLIWLQPTCRGGGDDEFCSARGLAIIQWRCSGLCYVSASLRER